MNQDKNKNNNILTKIIKIIYKQILIKIMLLLFNNPLKLNWNTRHKFSDVKGSTVIGWIQNNINILEEKNIEHWKHTSIQLNTKNIHDI